MPRKVLILSASAGAGHVRAAQALERAFEASGEVEEVRHVDTLEFTNPLFRRMYSKAYIDMVNTMPEVLGWLYDQLDTPWKNRPTKLAFEKLNTRPFAKLLRKYQPDVTVCTHFLPAEIIAWMRAKAKLVCRQATVVTDFDVHAMWLCQRCEHYFVAIDETRAHLQELGISPGHITVTGIPIDPVFSAPADKAAMRLKHGLRADLTTILVSAGGFGVGRVEELLDSLVNLRNEAQIIAVCGKNEELKTKVENQVARLASHPRVTFKVLGFTKEMHELMTAADLIVGKPGGLTTSEALAKGLIYVVVNPIPGQEERNSDHLLEEGAAIRCNNLPVLAYKVDKLLDDPARLAAMRANSLRLARPNAAMDIVSLVNKM
ncbi:MAG: UDP-N-acetylglucosamine:LPS N-acetylglucosamine transferase [Planctomycetota bacterium]|nr:UDP-N-acetylglucosamine:LPS N-acetylglucosamine transferase [Planctomycetota bacterium]